MIENQKPTIPGSLAQAFAAAVIRKGEKRPVEQAKPPQEKK